MKYSNFLRTPVRTFTGVILGLTMFTIVANAGIDSYAIYLNDKLILKQSVLEPLRLESLALGNANINDQLIIYYSQCNAVDKTGKGRSIAVKDESGNLLKEWKFADASGPNTSMVIPVSELLSLKKNSNNNSLSLHYAAEGLSQGQVLASLNLGEKRSARHQARKED